MPQWIKLLPFEPKDESLDPQSPCKSQMGVAACPVLGGRDRGITKQASLLDQQNQQASCSARDPAQ